MKRYSELILVVFAAIALAMAAGGGCSGKGDGEGEKATEEQAQKYHCPMHPSYVSDRPGDCPICNMKLVPIEVEPPEEEGKIEEHSTHEATPGEESSAEQKAPPSGERKILFYRHPMKPDVTSPVPMKDEMGMDYVPVYADEAQEAEKGGVEGYASVRLSENAVQLAGVQTAAAVREDMARTVRTVGLVAPDERRVYRVHTKISGWVEKLFVNFTGQAVRAGQPILTVYSQELLASQEEYLRAIESISPPAGGDTTVFRFPGQALLGAARRRLELFDVPEGFIEELERSRSPQKTVTLDAPASGFVTAKDIFEGQRIEPGMELYSITDLSVVWIEAQVYEYEVPYVHMGQEAMLTLPYDPDARLTGRVSYIYPYLDMESRTLRVRFEFPNPEETLKLGMYANVDLEIHAGEGILIPDSGVMDTGSRQIVFVEKSKGIFEPREVDLGVRSGGRAQILSGVSEGELVVVKANFLLDSESRLRAGIAKAAAGDHAQHGGGQ
jgi:multidrug efflux pump subunit AcrA (membrane-fusion protein)